MINDDGNRFLMTDLVPSNYCSVLENDGLDVSVLQDFSISNVDLVWGDDENRPFSYFIRHQCIHS